MAYIRSYDTKQKRKGKTLKRYEVCWREPATDPATGLPTGKSRARQESYPTREAAEARRDELNYAKHGIGGTAELAHQRKAGKETFGYYADAWLATRRTKSAGSEKLRSETVDGYGRRLAVYALPKFSARPIASITSTECETYLAELVARGLSPATLNHHWSVFSHVFAYARRNNALASNPIEGVDFKGTSAARRNKRHHPIPAQQVAAVAASIGERYPVYELLTLFAAYTGLRAEELAGCEVRDLVFKPGANGTNAEICVERSKKRVGGQWVADNKLKSAKSSRVVPLPGWLTARMETYLLNDHPHGNPTSPEFDSTAPLWPNRALGGARRRGCRAVAPLDWSEPCDMGAFYRNVLKPALEAVGLPASRPAYTAQDGTPVPAVEGVRLHDLRHTFAALQLSAGVHFMQVSKWLGHSTYTLTLDVYGDYIPEGDGGAVNPLPEPTAPARSVEKANVVKLPKRQAI